MQKGILSQLGIRKETIMDEETINKSNKPIQTKLSLSKSNNNIEEPLLTSVLPKRVPDINVFTDGSSINNGKKYARGGYAAVFPDYPEYTKSETLREGVVTNNRAEYSALILAFEQCELIDPGRKRRIVVYTDSELLINSITKWLQGWKKRQWKKADGKPVLNRDLLEIIDSWMMKRNIVMHHVRAHTGRTDWASTWNNIADEMARKAADIVDKHVDSFFRIEK